jgi:tetratricopeptide (TPR) repeat protein
MNARLLPATPLALLLLLAASPASAQDAAAAPEETPEETPEQPAPSDAPASEDEPAAPAPAPAAPAPAAAPAADAAAETLSFADHLFLDGDWYRSITEYRRYLFEVKGRSAGAPRAALAIGEALLRGEQWDAAGRQLDGVAQRTRTPELRSTALFGAGRAYLLDQRPELAKPRLRLLVEDANLDKELRAEAMWLLAWGHFDAGELEQAYTYFSQLAQEGGRHAEDASGAAQAITDREGIEQKDPLLAGVLSLIPGLGHFYLGRWGVGVTSMAWNGLFLLATVHAWISGNWGVALVLTLFEVGWYAGGVFGAVAGAFRYNRDAVRNWRDDILLRYGAGRELPEMHLFDHRGDAKPGSLIRFGGSF